MNYPEKFFKGTDKALIEFLESTVKIAALFIGMALGAKSKIVKLGKLREDNLKSLSGGWVLSLIDQHGNNFG